MIRDHLCICDQDEQDGDSQDDDDQDNDDDLEQDDKITLTGSVLQHHLLLLAQPERSLVIVEYIFKMNTFVKSQKKDSQM